MIRIYASDPAYQEVNDIAEAISRAVNAHCWWNLAAIPGIERAVLLADLYELWEELAR